MESKAKFAGHPIHPMLVVFPLGLLATAVVFDVVFLISEKAEWALVSWYMIGAGVVGGLLAALFGWLDWFAIPGGTRAKRIGLWHGLLNVTVLGFFALSWFLRRDNPALPPTGAVVAALAGAAITVVAAWLGGELVNRLGVGVYEGAHLDSPSSLSDLPAGANLGRASRPRTSAGYSGYERRANGSSSYAGIERRTGLRTK
ncbi:MAG TPA: DUF2231 domain-containing protein [Gemmatimonadales bacterium]